MWIKFLHKVTVKLVLLEVAFDADRENADVLVVGNRSLDEPGIDHLLIAIQSAVAVVADLQCRYQLFDQLAGATQSTGVQVFFFLHSLHHLARLVLRGLALEGDLRGD